MRYARSLAAALLAVLLALGALLFATYRDVREQTLRELNVQQTVHARQAARGIQDHMGQIVATLDFLAHLPQIVAMDERGREIVAYCANHFGDEVRGVTRVDAAGRIAYSHPHRPETIGRDISGQEHVREIMRTHRPVISDVFTAVQGFQAIAVHVPVFDAGRYDGTIAFLLSFDSIAKRYIEDIRVGASGYAWVVSRNGVEISCPVPGHVGRRVVETCRDYPEVLAMARRMLAGERGEATYRFDRVRGRATEGQIKQAVFLPIPIGDTFWSIVVATPEDEALSSLEGFRLKFVLVTLALLGSCTACTFLLVRARVERQERRKRDAVDRALQRSEALYRALVETTDTGFGVLDCEGRLVDANAEYVRLTGRGSVDEIRGHSVLEWTADSARQKSAEAVATCVREKSVRNLAVDYVAPGGAVTSVEVNATVVDQDGDRRILALCRDITERKRLEAQLVQAQKMESVGRLAGGVAHDFNNMLNVINGYAEMALLRTSPSDPLHHELEEILKAGERSAALTSQLLAFARRQVVSPRRVDLNEVVPRMLTMLQRLIGEHIALAWLPGRDLWPVRMDPSQLDQILANLVVNARDAIAGAGRVTIETSNEVFEEAHGGPHPGGPPGEYVTLTVTDDGAGMSEETLSHAFEPFFTTKAVGEGTGLGLATVYGIVDQNGGFLRVTSHPGEGTVFRVFLPRLAEEGRRPAQIAPDPPRGGTETVLLVEDDPSVLQLGRSLLSSLGYRVLAAGGAEEALRRAREHPGPIDLLLTDVVMPDMNGKELLERLRESRPDLPCLFVSGYPAEIIAKRGVLEEGVQFVQKPFSLRALASKVREVLDAGR